MLKESMLQIWNKFKTSFQLASKINRSFNPPLTCNLINVRLKTSTLRKLGNYKRMQRKKPNLFKTKSKIFKRNMKMKRKDMVSNSHLLSKRVRNKSKNSKKEFNNTNWLPKSNWQNRREMQIQRLLKLIKKTLSLRVNWLK